MNQKQWIKSRLGAILCTGFSICMLVMMLIPGLNPARISDLMDTTSNFLKSVFDYDAYVGIFNQSIELGLIDSADFTKLHIGIIALFAAVCVTLLASIVYLFLEKAQKIARYFITGGAFVGAVGVFLFLAAYGSLDTMTETQIKLWDTGAIGYYQAVLPVGAIVMGVLLLLTLVSSLFNFKAAAAVNVSRILAAIMLIGTFFSVVNPVRICKTININDTFFVDASSRKNLLNVFPSRYYTKEFISEKLISNTWIFALIGFIAVLLLIITFCFSFGELRMKRIGSMVAVVASAAGMVSMCLLAHSKTLIENTTTNATKIIPMLPLGIFFYFILFLIMLTLNVYAIVRLPKPTALDKFEMESKYKLFLMILPFIALVIVFSYLPLWGWRIAFFDYTPGIEITKEDFTGLFWFKYLFRNAGMRREFLRVMKNTLCMSGLGLASSFLPLIFAIFISEIKRPRYKRVIQTITTLPNFISWVLVYSIATAMFDTSGFMNTILQNLGVITASERVNYLVSSDWIYLKMLAWGIWKGLGWSAIVYIAAISGIDQQLYEAATVDGAGRFRRMWNITLPGLLPTFFVLFILSIAGILSNGLEQYLMFDNSGTRESIEVLDLYVYNKGFVKGNYSLATVVGMGKSIVSIVLLFAANGLSKLVRGESVV